MSVAAQLAELERLDGALVVLERQISEQRRQQRENPGVTALEARLADLRARERALGADQRRLEVELAELEDTIQRDRTRLYGGKIVDPRELAALERELEHYAARRDPLEERLLLLLEEIEALQAEITACSREANIARARWEANRPALARETEEAVDALASLRAEREQLVTEIEPRARELYERVRGSSGHAVSTVINGVCQSCRVALPAKDVQHARSGQLVTCANCARILYVPG